MTRVLARQPTGCGGSRVNRVEDTTVPESKYNNIVIIPINTKQIKGTQTNQSGIGSV